MEQNLRKICLAASLAVVGAVPVGAKGLNDFDARVRQTLVDHPEIILEVFKILEDQSAAAEKASDRVMIDAVSVELFAGVEEGKPVVVEFLDYNCGYCQRNEPDVQTLKLNRPDVTVIPRMFPILGAESDNLAKMMLGLRQVEGNEAFERENVELLADKGRIKANIKGYFESKGYDLAAIVEVAESKVVADEIAMSHQLARRLQITGTPAFVSRDAIIRGFADIAALEDLVSDPAKSEELAEQ